MAETGIDTIETYYPLGLIDNPANLSSRAAYIVSGENDTVVPTKNQEAIQMIYEEYLMSSLSYELKDIGHTVPAGQPVEALEWLYNELGYESSPNDPSTDTEADGVYRTFDQTDFRPPGWDFDDTTFEDEGYIYIPNDCLTTTCRIHFALHGCGGSAEFYPDK